MCLDAIKWERRVLILSHRGELLEQNQKHALYHGDLEGKVGLYSAGLGSRDTEHPILVAGIQSVYRRMPELGAFHLILVDEAHLISEREDSMYQQLLTSARILNPDVRLVGLTATPYRTGTGWMCAPENTFQDISYEVSVEELIKKGFLSKLKSKAGTDRAVIKTDNCRIERGDYVESEMAESAMALGMVPAAVSDIIEKTKGRKKVLVFSVNIAHGMEICNALKRRVGDGAVRQVYGDSIDRKEILVDFSSSETVRYLINCNLLTTGFDYPAIDCVVLLRPTVSPGLYYQMVGRGLRLDSSKSDCLVLDYGGNIRRHGPLSQIDPGRGRAGKRGVDDAPTKQCPKCGEVVMRTTTLCPDCGEVFKGAPIEVDHDVKADNVDIMGKEPVLETVGVTSVEYLVHVKRDPATGNEVSRTMRVVYKYKIIHSVSEWVCFEHQGYALRKAEKWWRERSIGPFPCDVDDAVERCNNGEVREPCRITIKTGGKYPEIVGYEYKQEATV